MGQKVNPISFRLGITRSWDSLWYAEKSEYVRNLQQDLEIRKLVNKELVAVGVSRIKVERSTKKVKVIVYVARPGMVLSKKGEDVKRVQGLIEKMSKTNVILNIVETKKADTNAVLIAKAVANQIERRVSHKKAMKRGMETAMKAGSLGIRIIVSGRLGGAEIARTEWYREGRVPLHTMRSDIGYGFTVAKTTYGVIGVKVLVYNGDRGSVEY